MVVHKSNKVSNKVALALSTSLVAVPTMLGVSPGLGSAPVAQATAESREVVMYVDTEKVLEGVSFDNIIQTSSEWFSYGENQEGDFILIAPSYPGTFTVYVYETEELDHLLEEIHVIVKSHRNEADTDNDGLINIADIVQYLRANPQQESDFGHDDIVQLVKSLDSMHAEPNQPPQFKGVDPDERFWLEIPNLDSPNSNGLFLHWYFEDEDYENYFINYQIQNISSTEHADFKIIYDYLQYTTHNPEAQTHDLINVTVRAMDQHGAYADGTFTIERNLPPRLVDEENRDFGTHHYDLYTGDLPTVTVDLNDYFVEPNGEHITYDYHWDYENFDLLSVDLDQSLLTFDLNSAYVGEFIIGIDAYDPNRQSATATFTITFEQETP